MSNSDREFLDSISRLFLEPNRPSPGYLINPSISDDRRRGLTLDVLRAFVESNSGTVSGAATTDPHKVCVTLTQNLKEKQTDLIRQYEDLSSGYEELYKDYEALGAEYKTLLGEQELTLFCLNLAPTAVVFLESLMSNAMDDDADDNLHLQPINHNATRDELVEALKASQLSVVKLLAENRQLRTENSNLLANSSKKRRNNGLNNNLLGYKSEVLRFAKHFLFTRALFVPIAVFQPNTIQMPEDPRNCFENNDTYTLSITSALYEDIPEKFHSLLDYHVYGNFGKDFIQRKATLYPPILFPGSTRNMNEVFTGPIIMDIHRLMYFGPSSLILGSKPAQNSLGIKLGFHDVTESSVSAATILTRFVLSADTEWAAKGAISKIEWEEEYRAYHKMLACNRHLPHVKAIFKKIHKFVFAGTTSSLATASNSNADEDDELEDTISDALRRFELGMDPDGDDLAQPDGGNLGNGTRRDVDGAPAPEEPPVVGGAPAPEEPTREEGAEEEGAEEVRSPARRRTGTRSGKAKQRKR
ncbi:hypothetical protein B0H13DRAFT_2656206 [Mycena leptocephala]|nr:hypothetical protein B0H13DRAFT_2656206 [Mycena leptocephala]